MFATFFSRGSTSNKCKILKKMPSRIFSAGRVNDDILCWNMPPHVTVNSDCTGLFIITTTHENKPISKEHSTSLPPNSKVFLHITYILFKPINKIQYCTIEEKCRHGVPEDSYNSLLSSINGIDAIELINVTSILNNGPDCLALTNIFMGFSAANVDDSFKIIDHHALQIHNFYIIL